MPDKKDKKDKDEAEQAKDDAEQQEREREERERREAENAPPTPDPGYQQPLQREPPPPRLTEEQVEEERERREQAEEDARKAAEGKPEDPSVEGKNRQPVIVNKEAFEREWEAQKSKFPGVEPEFGKDHGDGYVELTNLGAPSMAYATGLVQPTMVDVDRDRTQHGWANFVDNTRVDQQVLPLNVGPEDDLEAGGDNISPMDYQEIDSTPQGRKKAEEKKAEQKKKREKARS